MKWLACGAAVLLAGAICVGSGCDDASDPPPHLVADQPAPKPVEADVRPTTQELLEGPRKAVSLGELPGIRRSAQRTGAMRFSHQDSPSTDEQERHLCRSAP